ncbi:L-proline trans-4-hydroxylase-like isoform X2 [Mytilus edulis]|uniref:L-proline trans-4-hydroxylase-like isoform X2 n=1 Tax=Mytilus edulis TaxID=6550 RepID=UPI0039EE2910
MRKKYTFVDDLNVTNDMIADFQQHGLVIIRSLLDQEEVNMILKCITGNDDFTKELFTLEKGEMKTFRTIWNQPGTDVTGMVARSDKVVNTCEALLGGDVYHYHSKFMLKDAKVAAPHYWHQDYGYWYHNGCLYPDMMTVFVALDPCTKENGCLEILPGSHKCGRIEHNPIDGQFGADKTRVDAIKEKCPLIYAELKPGDAIFFHSNVLHHSSANRSNKRRWAYLMAYNKVSNNPVIEHHHPRYTPLQKVPNSAIKECTNFTDMSGKDFINPCKNESLVDGYKEK